MNHQLQKTATCVSLLLLFGVFSEKVAAQEPPGTSGADVAETSGDVWSGNDAPNFFAVDLGLVIDFVPRQTTLDPLDQDHLHQLVSINKKGDGLESALIVTWGDDLGKADKEEDIDNMKIAQQRGEAVAEFLRSQYKITKFDIVNMEKPIEGERRAGSDEVALKEAEPKRTDEAERKGPAPHATARGLDEQVGAVIHNGGPQTAVVVIRQKKSKSAAH